MIKRLSCFFTIILAFSIVFSFRSTLYAAGNISISPTSGGYAKNATISVRININTGGDNVNAAQVYLSYPQDKLQFQSISTSGSAFSIIAEKSGGGGVVSLAGGSSSPGFSGSKYIGLVSFKVLSDTGTATVQVRSDSQILRDSDNQNIFAGGNTASFTIAGTQQSQSTPTVSPSSLNSQRLTNFKVDSSDPSKFIFTWTTAIATESFLEYGVNNEFEFKKTLSAKTTSHRVELTTQDVGTGETYYARAKLVEANGREVTSETISFTMTGLSINLVVQDSSGNPVKQASVILAGQELQTDLLGKAIAKNIKPGMQGVIVRKDGKSYINEITVTDNSEDYVITVDTGGKLLEFDIPSVDSNSYPFYIAWATVALLALSSVGLLIWVLRKKQNQF
jgi:hypothetical protein